MGELVHDLNGVLLRTEYRAGRGRPRYSVRAKLVEDRRGWNHNGLFTSYYDIRPDTDTVRIGMRSSLIGSLRYVLGNPNLVAVDLPDSPLHVWMEDFTDAITMVFPDRIVFKLFGDELEYPKHPFAPIRVEQNRIVGDESDWVVAITDHGINPILKRAPEMMEMLRRIEFARVPTEVFA